MIHINPDPNGRLPRRDSRQKKQLSKLTCLGDLHLGKNVFTPRLFFLGLAPWHTPPCVTELILLMVKPHLPSIRWHLRTQVKYVEHLPPEAALTVVCTVTLQESVLSASLGSTWTWVCSVIERGV